MEKYLLLILAMYGTILALADPSHEIEEASDKKKIEHIYRKARSCKSINKQSPSTSFAYSLKMRKQKFPTLR